MPLQWQVEAAGVTDVALWQLLILVCVALPIGTSLSSARHANVGPGGYALSIAVGIAVGACCGWAMWAAHDIVGTKLQQLAGASLARLEWYFRAFYLVKLFWIGFAGFLGLWLSFAVLHLVF